MIISRQSYLEVEQLNKNIQLWNAYDPVHFEEYDFLPSTTHIYLHCPGTEGDQNWEQVVETIWRVHTIDGQIDPKTGKREEPYGDIGYHYLIDPEGDIWEGRARSIEMMDYPLFFIRGAHIKHANTKAMGVCFLSESGCFEHTEMLTDNQINSFIQLASFKLNQQQIDPYSLLTHRDHIDARRVEGHTLYPNVNKECPGINVINRIDLFIEEIWQDLIECHLQDTDGDTIPDIWDNCPEAENPNQDDSDGDGVGDWCDDSDHDGIVDAEDDCFNFPQSFDDDNDGWPNECDNCPDVFNPEQNNIDGDEFGDLCDLDKDGDGIPNNIDNCEDYYNPGQEDSDNDGVGDACLLIEDCDDAQAQAILSALILCVDGKYNDLKNLPDPQMLSDLNDCIQTRTNSKQYNFYKLSKAWKKYKSFIYDCIDELYPNVEELTPEQYSEVKNCAVEKVHDYAENTLNWSPTIGEPSSSELSELNVILCECRGAYLIHLYEQKIEIAQSALACFNATGEFCATSKNIDRYTRGYWMTTIRNLRRDIQQIENTSCNN